MLANDCRDLPDAEQQRRWVSPDWVAEPKLNGVRMLCFVGPGELRFTTRVKSKRTGLFQERTDNFPHLRDLPLSFLEGTILDGELILEKPRAFTTGSKWAVGSLACTMATVNTSPEHAVEFQAREGWATFQVFDLLRDRGRAVEKSPFEERRARLMSIFSEMAQRGVDLSHIQLVPQVMENKRAFYDAVLAADGEGVMMKNKQGIYKHNGRSADVLKVKKFLTVDGFISGYTAGRKGNTGLIGSLLVSAFDSEGSVREIAGVAPYDLSRGSLSNLREAVTVRTHAGPQLHPDYLGRVVELGAFCWNKNLRLVHAKILRFRDGDKVREDCVMQFNSLRVG